MRSGSWSSLVTLRERRADAALAESRRTDQRCREADQTLDAAKQKRDRDEMHRVDLRRAVYESMAGRALSVGEMMSLRDRIHASTLQSQADRDHVLRLTEKSQTAGEAAEQAAAIYNERRRAVEKSEAIRRKLALEQNRKTDIQAEIELEDVAVMSAAFPLTAGRQRA